MTTADKPLDGFEVIFTQYHVGAPPMLLGSTLFVRDKGTLLWWIERSEEEYAQ